MGRFQIPFPVDEQSAVDPGVPLGFEVKIGKTNYKLAKAGVTGLTVALATTQPAEVPNHQGLAYVSGGTVGSTTVVFTLGATLASDNQYKDGELIIVSGAGAGYRYEIRGHAAVASAGNITLMLKDPIKVALTVAGSSVADLKLNSYNGTLIAAANADQDITGIPRIAVTAAYYYWSQTGGIAIYKSQGGSAEGDQLEPSASAGGSLATFSNVTNTIVSTALHAVDDGTYGLCRLKL